MLTFRRGREDTSVVLYVTRSNDGGQTWQSVPLATSAPGPDCSDYLCGWAFLGAQMVMASDEAGTIFALWNSGLEDFGPQRISFARSSDGGATWSEPLDVSTAPTGVDHAFPAVTVGAAGDVRIAWMDARADGLWNTDYRSSTDGGRHAHRVGRGIQLR